MRAVIYEADWQMLRINCLAARNDDGGWSTETGTKGNLELLYRYLTDADDLSVRRYRVHNCLNAVVMGYHGQKADVALIDRVRNFRETNRTAYYRLDVVEGRALDWDWVAETQKLSIWKADDLDFLLRDLRKRAQKGSERTRPELHMFIHCIKAAQDLSKKVR